MTNAKRVDRFIEWLPADVSAFRLFCSLLVDPGLPDVPRYLCVFTTVVSFKVVSTVFLILLNYEKNQPIVSKAITFIITTSVLTRLQVMIYNRAYKEVYTGYKLYFKKI